MKDFFNMFWNKEDREWWKNQSRVKKVATGYVCMSLCLMIVVASGENLMAIAIAMINLAASVAFYSTTD